MIKLKTLAIAIASIFTTAIIPQTAIAVAQTPISRNQVEQRALQMINLKWSYSSQNNSKIDTKYSSFVTQPKQLGTVSGEMTGIPYCWGGFDGLDTASYNQPWSSFSDAVKKGAYAGNTNSDVGMGYISGTAGLDCSGFVQAAFNIKDYKQSSSSILTNYFTKINMSDIKHMDILDHAGSHVVIFDSWGTQNGISGAITYESTPDTFYGGIQGAKKYFLSMNKINSSGYVAARYNYITEESTLPKPVETGIFAQATDNLNLRATPSTGGSILTVIPQNAILYVNSYSSGWYQVVYNGKTGWIWGQYVAGIPSGRYVTVKNATQLNIRSLPNSTAPIVGTLSQNQYAKVLNYSADGKWMQITINNITGWSSAAYLSYIY